MGQDYRALLSFADAEFGVQVIVEAVVEPEHCHLFPSGWQVVGVILVVPWVLVPSLAVLKPGFESHHPHGAFSRRVTSQLVFQLWLPWLALQCEH